MKNFFANRVYTTIIACVFSLIFLSDLISLVYKPWGKIGVELWIFSYIFLIFFAIKALFFIFAQVFKHKIIITFFMMIILLILVCFNMYNTKSVSGETTQEIACMLNLFKESSDWGFRERCFLGYPSRQYLLPSLPSLFGDRSQINLHLGTTLYFLLAVIIFTSSILKFLDKNPNRDFITGILLALFLHITFFNHFMFFFEQSIFPFLFGLILCGLFLHFIKDKNMESLLLIGLVMLYLVFSYTPSLSLFFLAITVAIFFLKESNLSLEKRLTILFIILITAISFIISLGIRSDIRFFDSTRSIDLLSQDLLASFDHILFQTQGKPMVSPQFNLIFLFTLFGSICFSFGKKFFFLALWVMATLILSVLSVGYTYYGIDFRLHRATVIFPVIFTMLAMIVTWLNLDSRKYQYILFALFIFLFITGLFYHKNYLDKKVPNIHAEFITFFQSVSEEAKGQNTLYIDSSLNRKFVSLNDELRYFLPQTKSFILTNNCDISNSIMSENIFLLLPVQQTPDYCLLQDSLKFLSQSSFTDGTNIALYKIGK